MVGNESQDKHYEAWQVPLSTWHPSKNTVTQGMSNIPQQQMYNKSRKVYSNPKYRHFPNAFFATLHTSLTTNFIYYWCKSITARYTSTNVKPSTLQTPNFRIINDLYCASLNAHHIKKMFQIKVVHRNEISVLRLKFFVQ